MKCTNCGYNMGDDVRICPFCGKRRARFRKSHAETLHTFQASCSPQPAPAPKEPAFGRKSLKTAVLCVLSVGILLLSFCIINIYQIYKQVAARQILKDSDTYTTALKELEAAGSYEEFIIYWNMNNLNFVKYEEPFSEYCVVTDLSIWYKSATQHISAFCSSRYMNASKQVELLKAFVDSYDRFISKYDQYIIEKDRSYYGIDDASACFSQSHLNSIENMKQNLDGFIVTYFGLDETDLDTFRTTDKENRLQMLKQAMNLSETDTAAAPEGQKEERDE